MKAELEIAVTESGDILRIPLENENLTFLLHDTDRVLETVDDHYTKKFKEENKQKRKHRIVGIISIITGLLMMYIAIFGFHF